MTRKDLGKPDLKIMTSQVYQQMMYKVSVPFPARTKQQVQGSLHCVAQSQRPRRPLTRCRPRQAGQRTRSWTCSRRRRTWSRWRWRGLGVRGRQPWPHLQGGHMTLSQIQSSRVVSSSARVLGSPRLSTWSLASGQSTRRCSRRSLSFWGCQNLSTTSTSNILPPVTTESTSPLVILFALKQILSQGFYLKLPATCLWCWRNL